LLDLLPAQPLDQFLLGHRWTVDVPATLLDPVEDPLLVQSREHGHDRRICKLVALFALTVQVRSNLSDAGGAATPHDRETPVLERANELLGARPRPEWSKAHASLPSRRVAVTLRQRAAGVTARSKSTWY
jgi:hypothetical protein